MSDFDLSKIIGNELPIPTGIECYSDGELINELESRGYKCLQNERDAEQWQKVVGMVIDRCRDQTDRDLMIIGEQVSKEVFLHKNTTKGAGA